MNDNSKRKLTLFSVDCTEQDGEGNMIAEDGKTFRVDKDGKQQPLPAKQHFDRFANKLLDYENLVVLAGSGVSMALNKKGEPNIAPSMGDLWNACRKDDEKLFDKIINLVHYNDIQQETYQDAEGKVQKRQDIELLLSLCEGVKEYGFLATDKNLQIDKFLTKAVKIIQQQTSFTQKVEDSGWGEHIRLLNTLGRRGPKQARMKLFTTNYDLCFEQAASRCGLVVLDGFSFSQPSRFSPMWFQYDVVHRMPDAEASTRYLPNVFHLYKIHGSVNWYEEPDGIYKSAQDGNKSALLIYPSRNKYQTTYKPPYMDMMSAFTAALRQPRTALICLGFGFNDAHLNNAIMSAITNNQDFMLMVATHNLFKDDGGFNTDCREKLKLATEVARHSGIALVDGDFGDFVNALPERRKTTPEGDLQQRLLEIFRVSQVQPNASIGTENE